jgi:hypothetical protein
MTLIIEESNAERQLQAVLFALITLGYVDGSFDPEERQFIEDTIGELVEGWIHRSGAYAHLDPALRESMARYEKRHLFAVLDAIDQSLAKLMDTEVSVEDDREAFVSSRLMLRCFETLSELTAAQREHLLGLVDQLIEADGVVHPAELRFRDALVSELVTQPAPAAPAPAPPFALSLEREPLPAPRDFAHPFVAKGERPFPNARRPRKKMADADIRLMRKAQVALQDLRRDGWGRLAGVSDVNALAGQAPFVDTLVHAFPPDPERRCDYILVGDLHGCYGSLKAVLAQSDFFGRVERHRRDPTRHPDVKLIFLGDYLDRGHWSWEGVVRLVLRLFVEYPRYVIPLVGNHEWLVQRGSRTLSSVMPADAILRWNQHLPEAYFAAAKALFDSLGSVVLIDRVMVVHGGIPRQSVLDRWNGLSSLNDPTVRLEMCWSDPVMLATVAPDLQERNQRFAFGIDQFAAFMDAVGARVMFRGHEKVPAGFRVDYEDGWYGLYTVFSAGGYNNQDLPEYVDYRQVQPSFVLLQEREGRFSANPVRIEWERFNTPETNPFLAELLG